MTKDIEPLRHVITTDETGLRAIINHTEPLSQCAQMYLRALGHEVVEAAPSTVTIRPQPSPLTVARLGDLTSHTYHDTRPLGPVVPSRADPEAVWNHFAPAA